MKALFLIGELGLTQSLYYFLCDKLKPIRVMQPSEGLTAKMRGAVLSKFGLGYFKSRILRRSYGIQHDVPFRYGYHPTSRMIITLDAFVQCEGVMQWFARKV